MDFINKINPIQSKLTRINLVIISMVIFSFIYLLLPDTDFSGVNNVTELIKEELLKEKVRKDLKESKTLNGMQEVEEMQKMEGVETFKNLDNNVFHSGDEKIEEEVKEIEEIVEEEYKPENVQNNLFEQFFSRLYFSIITGCLLGYGDMYPVTLRGKFVVMSQALITLIIIVM